MYEVEVKVRADHGPVRERLEDLGATRREVVRQEDTYYDAPHRAFGETDEALRVRRERPAGETIEGDDDRRTVAHLTYKGPLVEDASKTRQEYETGVYDDRAASAILEALGFSPAATVDKERERYDRGEYTITLDDVDGLGTFVEVETESREADIEPAREGARDLLERLGLDPDEQIRTAYLDLLQSTTDGERDNC